MSDRTGASTAQLAGYLEHQSYQVNSLGVQCGYRYHDSPTIPHEDGAEPPWASDRIVPTTWPGGRAPSVRLADGTEMFDLLGAKLSLVDMSGNGAGTPMVKLAAERGIPISHVTVPDAHVRSAWERDLVLVRPDQHVAWRGDELPVSCAALLDIVTGR